MSEMTPREIVQELDKHIIGQVDAKRAVANALRNRWRRINVEDEELRTEITPKNILMIGPTGVGKTEISRRLAKLANAPFIKVEATKFTEVGYVGREVDSIIRDLADLSIKMTREDKIERIKTRAEHLAEERVLDIMCGPVRGDINDPDDDDFDFDIFEEDDQLRIRGKDSPARKKFRGELRNGNLDQKEIEIDVSSSVGVEIFGPPGLEEMTHQLQDMMKNLGGRKSKKRKVKVKQALKIFTDEEAENLIDDDEIKMSALENVEQNGIVFIDEIDKITSRSDVRGPDVSREGVQRDLLPLIEGSTVTTKYGMIKTDHILFIASGAFQVAKPSDLIPELQGRLPIRVELTALTTEDFIRILTETDASLTDQYYALMETEGLTLEFRQSGVRSIAEFAWQVNEATENIGARRLYTVMERLLEKVSFEAADRGGDLIRIDEEFVKKELEGLVEDQELSRYIL